MGPFSVVRWVRAASFAATCAALAVLGHLAGGGSFDPAQALKGFLLLLPPALALTGRERSLGSILPATALSQVILHVLLTPNADRPTMAHHVHTPGMDMSQLDQAGSTSSGMLLMHAAAVLLTSVWLRWVEAGLCTLVRQLAGRVLRPLLVLLFMAAGWTSPGPRAIAHVGEDETACIRLFLRHALVRRGPPRGQAGTALAV
ncbi:hypothetical protein [Nonomuraea sp. SYSU D8015]|uniref:hypothetical protein n=1 Tax=Nonomuraea sp. SYSU D8015 TaxID=2593644 RepID=UPI00166179A0|nr:hypothetical protein [Nonomuraea sp. SYSU D8015]